MTTSPKCAFHSCFDRYYMGLYIPYSSVRNMGLFPVYPTLNLITVITVVKNTDDKARHYKTLSVQLLFSLSLL
jgi:hypothetical protein